MGSQWCPKPTVVADKDFISRQCARNDGLQKPKIKLKEDLTAKTSIRPSL